MPHVPYIIYGLHIQCNVLDDLGTLVDTEKTCIETEVVITRITPGTVGIMLVVCGPLLILIRDPLDRLDITVAIYFDDQRTFRL